VFWGKNTSFDLPVTTEETSIGSDQRIDSGKGCFFDKSTQQNKNSNAEIESPTRLSYPSGSCKVKSSLLALFWHMWVNSFDLATQIHWARHIIRAIIEVTVTANKVNMSNHEGRRISGLAKNEYLQPLPRVHQVERQTCRRCI